MAEILFTAFLDFFKHFVLSDVSQVVILSGCIVVCVWIPFCSMLKIGGDKK